MFRSSFAALAVVVAGIGVTAGEGIAAPAGVLAPHRAVYDIELKQASERSGIEGMRGRMVYEFNGSECDGYTTNFRFVTRINTGDQVRVTDQQSMTFEDIASGQFHFETKSFTDDKLDKDVSGAASEVDGKVAIELMQPQPREVELASSRFPASHMKEVIGNAQSGKRMFEARIFDGSEDGDESYLTTTVVGNRQQPTEGDPDAKKAGELANAAYWPVSIAYFDEDTSGDVLPVYTQSFKLYENGVTRDLTLDYGDFVLTGRLSALEILGTGDCAPTASKP